MYRQFARQRTMNFSSKVYAAMLGMVVLLTCALTFLSLQGQRKSIEDKTLKRGQMFARILADGSRLGLFAGDPQQLSVPVRAALDEGVVIAACVFNEEGVLLQRQAQPVWEKTDICRQVEQSAVDTSYQSKDKRPFRLQHGRADEFWSPVLSKPSRFTEEGIFFAEGAGEAASPLRIGSVAVIFDRAEIERSLRNTLYRHGLILILFLGFGAALSLYLVRTVTRPLTVLVDEIRRRSGTVADKDDLGMLSSSYSAMVESLGDSFVTISELKSGLEDKVRELEEEIRRRRQTEASLRESEEKFRSISEGIADGVAIVRGETFLWANKAFCTIFDCCATELADLQPAVLLPQPGQPPRSSWLADCLGGTEKQVRFPVQTRRSGGEEIMVEVSARGMIFEGQGAIQVIIRDITEHERAEKTRKELEVRALAQSKLASLGKIATGVAHEINQPLSFIRIVYESALRDLERQRLDPDATGETFREALRQVGRITAITDHLRSFGRADAGSKGDVLLPEVLSNSLTLMGEILRLNSVELDKEIAGELPAVKGNSVQLEQVFINLFQNSVDAMALVRKRKIRVAMRGVGSRVEVVFSDSGPGIPAEARPSIFTPFYTTKGQEDRTGLGLAIIHSIIREHGGSIEYRELPDWGASFVVMLPAGTGFSTALGQGADNI